MRKISSGGRIGREPRTVELCEAARSEHWGGAVVPLQAQACVTGGF